MDRVKYPRTPHLPWSPGATDNDRILKSCQHFEGRDVIVTEKMDGENTTLYRDGLHARSINGRAHPSQDWIRALHGRVAHEIPEGWRVCGENLYARHSVVYDALESYFLVFSVWDNRNTALSWDQTVEWSQLLGLATVPVLWRGRWAEGTVKALTINAERQEGYVVRVTSEFGYQDFGQSLAKFVRPHHVQTDRHWKFQALVPNGMVGL